jgi:hypothetical protein
MRALGLGALAALVIGVTGCGDPIAGRWRAREPDVACPDLRVSFELDGDLSGSGVRPAQRTDGCFECQIAVSGERETEERYDLTFTFETCSFGDGRKTELLDCRVRLEGDRLACERCPGSDPASCVAIDFERDD